MKVTCGKAICRLSCWLVSVNHCQRKNYIGYITMSAYNSSLVENIEACNQSWPKQCSAHKTWTGKERL
eukprot:1161108-Pelagomonas_calceolata.AAC.3